MVRPRGWKKEHDRQGDIRKINWLKKLMFDQRRESEGNGYVV